MVDLFLEKSTSMYMITRVENVLNKFTTVENYTRSFVIGDIEMRKSFSSKRVTSVVDDSDPKAFGSLIVCIQRNCSNKDDKNKAKYDIGARCDHGLDVIEGGSCSCSGGGFDRRRGGWL